MSRVRPDDPLSAEDRARCEQALSAMQNAIDAFYASALRIGLHPFVEFAGLLRLFLAMCRGDLAAGRDFFVDRADAEFEQIAYMSEKLECIFGIASPGAVQTIVEFLVSCRQGMAVLAPDEPPNQDPAR